MTRTLLVSALAAGAAMSAVQAENADTHRSLIDRLRDRRSSGST